MPVYECGDCGERFRSKTALNEHKEDCSPSRKQGTDSDTAFNDLRSRLSSLAKLHPRRIRNAFTMRNIALFFGLFLMSTLFLGSAMFMMTTSPDRGDGGGGGNVQETSPPTGQSIQSAGDIPQVSDDELPESHVSGQPLSEDVQLYLLMRGGPQNDPAALAQYNCPEGCPELEQDIAAFAEEFNGWVYMAPNSDLDNQVVLTAPYRMDQQDAFDPDAAHSFVCQGLQNQPLACL